MYCFLLLFYFVILASMWSFHIYIKAINLTVCNTLQRTQQRKKIYNTCNPIKHTTQKRIYNLTTYTTERPYKTLHTSQKRTQDNNLTTHRTQQHIQPINTHNTTEQTTQQHTQPNIIKTHQHKYPITHTTHQNKQPNNTYNSPEQTTQ